MRLRTIVTHTEAAVKLGEVRKLIMRRFMKEFPRKTSAKTTLIFRYIEIDGNVLRMKAINATVGSKTTCAGSL